MTVFSLGPARDDCRTYGGGEGKWLIDGSSGPKADREGDTTPLVLLRSSEDIDVEWARERPLLVVRPWEYAEGLEEFEPLRWWREEVGADPDERGDIGLRWERME